MLRYTETILQKVSFNKELFRKELKKSIKWLKKEEVILLKAWVIINFGNTYYDVINEVFK
ncbi:MAG: hypothetical protein ACNA7V_12705 [Bacteroidales bacterium]